MTVYSQLDLATRVLRDLALYGPDEAPTDDDLQDVIETVGSDVLSMAVRGISIVGGSDQNVPQEYLSALSRRLGLAVGPSFGVFTMAEATQAIPTAEMYRRQLSARLPTGGVMELEFM